MRRSTWPSCSSGPALLPTRSRLQRGAGWVFLGGGGATLAALVAYTLLYGSRLDYRFEVASIGISWLVLIAGPVMLALLFARAPQPRHAGGITAST